MTDRFESDDVEDGKFVAGRIAYIKPTGSEEAHRLGLIPANIDLPDGMKLYVLHAEQHEAHGHTVDAKQARQMVQYLDDIITIMHIQIRARQDGGDLPFADTLLPDADESEKRDDRDTQSS